jgi:hypothetical protein
VVYNGYEYEPEQKVGTNEQVGEKYVWYGRILFNQKFTEGRIKAAVEFDEVDYRSVAQIMIQYHPATEEMLSFGIAGGGVKGGKGPLYGLRLWAVQQNQPTTQQAPGSKPAKIMTPLFQDGEGRSLQPKRPYNLEVLVRGSVVTAFIDSVEVGRYGMSIPSLPGQQVGIFCGSHKQIRINNICIEPKEPQAFVVMQFDTPAYEALFREVIEPVCNTVGVRAYRADFTYVPGVVIADIKRQIAESRLVIAEITPANTNVYYEVGYVDALNKPLILIADRKEGLKAFDVRAYRTIFYDDSIGGKPKIEADLRGFLQSILSQ